VAEGLTTGAPVTEPEGVTAKTSMALPLALEAARIGDKALTWEYAR